MTVTYQIDTSKLNQIIRDLKLNVDSFVEHCAQTINEEIKDSFGSDSPSQPGDPPGIDTGALKASMQAYENPNGRGWMVAAHVEYAVYLELGTSKMAARPFFVPVFHRWERRIVDEANTFGLIE